MMIMRVVHRYRSSLLHAICQHQLAETNVSSKQITTRKGFAGFYPMASYFRTLLYFGPIMTMPT